MSEDCVKYSRRKSARVLRSTDANQLGRRNLSPDMMRLLRGRLYNRIKGKQGAPEGNKNRTIQRTQTGNIEPERTAEKVAKQSGVSKNTVIRDAKFAKEVETKPELMKAIKERIPVSKAIRETKIAERKKNLKTEGVFDVIVLDPPWPMQKMERD